MWRLFNGDERCPLCTVQCDPNVECYKKFINLKLHFNASSIISNKLLHGTRLETHARTLFPASTKFNNPCHFIINIWNRHVSSSPVVPRGRCLSVQLSSTKQHTIASVCVKTLAMIPASTLFNKWFPPPAEESAVSAPCLLHSPFVEPFSVLRVFHASRVHLCRSLDFKCTFNNA